MPFSSYIKFMFGLLIVSSGFFICVLTRVWLLREHSNGVLAQKVLHRIPTIGWFDKQGNQSNMNWQGIHRNGRDHKKTLYKNKDERSFRPTNYQYYFDQGQWIKKPLHESGTGKFTNVYLYGASVYNSSSSSVWDQLRIYGQWLKRFAVQSSKNVNCCIRYRDGYIKNVNAKNILLKDRESNIPVFYFEINIPRRNDTNVLSEVAIITGNTACRDNDVPYIKPFYPRKEPGKLGISSKIAYGSLSSETIIEWVEAMKHLGVDKIITYADGSLNEAALKTLQYYERTGLVEVFPYTQPAKNIIPRDASQMDLQKMDDSKVVIYDSFERLRGYKYFGIIDMDEFLIPSKGRSLKQLMGDLLAQERRINKKAAGIFFKTIYFIKSWGVVNASSELDFGKYLNRTAWEPCFDRRKAIMVRDYVQYTNTHRAVPKFGYKMMDCSETDAYIRHYRSCRNEWNIKNKCMDNFRRVTTYEMIKWANENIATRVRQVRKELFG